MHLYLLHRNCGGKRFPDLTHTSAREKIKSFCKKASNCIAWQYIAEQYYRRSKFSPCGTFPECILRIWPRLMPGQQLRKILIVIALAIVFLLPGSYLVRIAAHPSGASRGQPVMVGPGYNYGNPTGLATPSNLKILASVGLFDKMASLAAPASNHLLCQSLQPSYSLAAGRVRTRLVQDRVFPNSVLSDPSCIISSPLSISGFHVAPTWTLCPNTRISVSELKSEGSGSSRERNGG